jgi:YHS domain-containing protein
MSTVVYFLVWGTIIFLMMRFGCGAHVMGYGHRHGGTKTSAAPLIDGARWAAPDKAVDPICGMSVEPATSKSAVHDGHVFYFCSQDCREKFEAAPALYTGIGKIEPQAMEQSDDHQH